MRLKSEKVDTDNLVSHVPDFLEATKITAAIKSNPSLRPSSEQEKELLQLQNECPILREEVDLLEKKVLYHYVCAKKIDWVETMLSKMSEDHMKDLGERFRASREKNV